MGFWQVHVGDVMDWCSAYSGPPFCGVLTDPPYGISFMSAKWDHGVPSSETWETIARHLLPGAHLLAFGGTRTWHRLAVAVEDAGLEMRDTAFFLYTYGSGMPKSLNVALQFEKELCHRQDDGKWHYDSDGELMADKPPFRHPEANHWNGHGTGISPSVEPIVVFRKPLEGTVMVNAVKHGTGTLAIDTCRVPRDVPRTIQGQSGQQGVIYGADQRHLREFMPHDGGGWPKNLLHDGSPGVLAVFAKAGQTNSGWRDTDVHKGGQGVANNFGATGITGTHYADKGTADRFFPCLPLEEADRWMYCPKASKSEKNAGVLGDNLHPTVKPLKLCTWLATLILPPPLGTPRRILVPFCGSGSEMLGCLLAGWDEVVGVELHPEYADIARQRLQARFPILDVEDF